MTNPNLVDRGTPRTAEPQSEAEALNVRVAQRYFDALNGHDLQRCLDLTAEDYRAETPAAAGGLDRQGYRAYLQNLISAFPDLHFELLLTVAQQDHVVANWLATGTQVAPWRSTDGRTLQTSTKKAELNGSTTFTCQMGKIAHSTTYFDTGDLMDQLGLASRE